MRIKVLASGSKGNSTFVEVGNTRLLIDIGMRCNYIENRLNELNLSGKDIDAILLTHEHNDHTLGLSVFEKKYNTPVYLLDDISLEIKNRKSVSNDFNINGVNIKSFKTSHDVPSVGYIINDELVYITDTGYINSKYFDLLKNKKIYIMESNHDVEMLETGPYPYYLKQRIWSDKGHLSNEMSSDYLNKFIGDNTEYIILAHLSETNNTEDIAITEFKKNNSNAKIKLLVAKPNIAIEEVIV